MADDLDLVTGRQGRFRWDHTGLVEGDDLLCCKSGYQLILGWEDFTSHAGLQPEMVFSDSVITTPIPLRTRVSTLTPEALWHPLFWLPEWLQLADGELETVWAVRVGLAMTEAGIYAPRLGWRDLLYDIDLHTSDEDDGARILSWLAGTADDQLDQLSLEPYLDQVDQTEIAEIADAITPAVEARAWALMADELVEIAAEVLDDGEDPADRLPIMAAIGQSLLRDVPTAGDSDDDGYGPDPAAFWAEVGRVADNIDATQDEVMQTINDISEWGKVVREEFWPAVTDLETMAEEAS